MLLVGKNLALEVFGVHRWLIGASVFWGAFAECGMVSAGRFVNQYDFDWDRLPFCWVPPASIAGVVMVCELWGVATASKTSVLSVMHIVSRRLDLFIKVRLNKFASPVHRAEMDPDMRITVGEVMGRKRNTKLTKRTADFKTS